jgi:hypothetical protein
MSRGPRARRACLAVLAVLGVTAPRAAAQEIPKPDYVSYLPPGIPAPVAQTRASALLQLFGDTADPGYRDVAPRDGIDDRRGAWLHRLAERFSPWLVRNGYGFPMDWRRFIREARAFPLYVDNFDVARARAEHLGTETIDMTQLGRRGCANAADGSEDCRLLRLVERYAPDRPLPPRVIGAEESRAQVLYFDWPGSDPASWRQEYASAGAAREPGRQWAGWERTYAHPFIAEARPAPDSVHRYELVFQYWFFYPQNDGSNIHEGDWEHLNVVVGPIGQVRRPLSADEMRAVLEARVPEDSLVIRRVAWYFHQKVFVGDFTKPDVYAPRQNWEREVDDTPEERENESWVWERLRFYAYADDDETRINTHPIGFIGGDPKGADRVVQAPNSYGRESHATFPFPGLYKGVGPRGAAEEIRERWDMHQLVIAGDASRTARVVRFDDPAADRIELLPDWERVLPLIRSDSAARADWAWMVLPIRWGYPATHWAFAGVVRYADTGNLSPVGPSFSGGWNRAADGNGFELYEPHTVNGFFPVGPLDNIDAGSGYLNLTAPLLVTLPPLDLAYRLIITPLRRLGRCNNPTFFTGEHLPFRVAGGTFGFSINDLPDEYARLFFFQQQSTDIRAALAARDTGTTNSGVSVSAARGVYGQLILYLGRQFASENLLRHSRSDLTVTEFAPTLGRDIPLHGTLSFYEYAGSLRYNFRTEGVQPFVKLGYGLTWYQLQDITVDGLAIAHPNTDWVRRPSLVPFANLLPNTYHAGAGLELVPVRNFGRLPGSLDLGMRAEAVLYTNDLGLETRLGRLVPTFDQRARRWQFNFSGTLAF